MRVAFDAVWAGGRFHGGTVYEADGSVLRRNEDAAGATRPGVTRLGGTLIPRLTDHHTHLGLSDQHALFRGGITDAIDLGWTPEEAAGWLADDPERPAVTIAGALLTAVGGYPVHAGWAPAGSSAELTGPSDAAAAVQVQRAVGASRIKVTLNTEAGPTIDDRTLRAVVDEAHRAGLPVTVHVQGEGQTQRAVDAGADQLAHAPFTERLADDLLERSARRGVSWVSTLDIHGWGRPARESEIAQDNVRRYLLAGGSVLYGTDLGNGPLAVGVNERELNALASAGMDAAQLMRSIAGTAPADVIGRRFAFVPGTPPHDPDALAAWLATARGVTVDRIPDTLLENS